MNLQSLIQRQRPPLPWIEGDNIPWSEPEFSRRMLQEHLSQSHDAASRRFEKIDQHVNWIFQTILGSQPAEILDLGCGPGLYTSRLAAMGCSCTGIDYAPASIEYARSQALSQDLDCSYIEQDIRQADYGNDFELILLLFGEFNVFCPADAERILSKAFAALRPGGRLLLEPHTYQAIQRIGSKPELWQANASGLFSDRPHLLLEESFWDQELQAATRRYFVLEENAAEPRHYAASYQAYNLEDYQRLLNACGFAQVTFFPSLTGQVEESQSDLIALLSIKTPDTP